MAPIEENIYGIHEVYRPSDKDADVDIVAVHGLNGHALKTWTGRKSKESWLSQPDLLPKYIKNARVLTWGYNASFSALTGAEPSKNRIHHHAQTLVAELYADRKLEGRVDKPIIFLCHSLGGIIVKRALSYANSRSSSKISHIKTIFACTYGILFFGTPHHGSSKASLLHTMQKLSSISVPRRFGQTESSLVSALEEESETLQNITDYFVPLMKNFSICFFWEAAKTDLKYKWDYIVEQSSAVPAHADAERASIAADHSGMVKFETSNSPGFKVVMDALMRFSEEAPSVVARNLARLEHALAEERQSEAFDKLSGLRVTPDVPVAPVKNSTIFVGGQEYQLKETTTSSDDGRSAWRIAASDGLERHKQPYSNLLCQETWPWSRV